MLRENSTHEYPSFSGGLPIQVLIEILEDVTNEALSSELLNLNDKEEMQREVITLLKQFEVAKKTLSALAELQISLPHPRVDGYRNLDWN